MTGVDSILEMISAKTQEKEKAIIEEAEKQQRERLAVAEDKATQKSTIELEKAEREAKAILERHEASLKLQAKHKILEAKEKIIQEVISTSLQKIGKLSSSSEYPKIITKLAIDGGVALNVDKVELILPEGQKVKLTTTTIGKGITDGTGNKTTVSISKETIRAIGGVIVRSEDGTKWVDNTFDARIEQLEIKIRDGISAILFR